MDTLSVNQGRSIMPNNQMKVTAFNRSDSTMAPLRLIRLIRVKPTGPDIGIVDGPFEYLTVGGVRLPLPFTTRMTVVRLSNGDLFLQSPIKFDEALASELQRMGTIRHLVSPNQFHYAHIGAGSKAFPDAISWAS